METKQKHNGRPPGYAAKFVDTLKANPGRWALYTDDGDSTASNYLHHRYGLEATSRRNGGGSQRSAIYARWNGEKTPTDSPVDVEWRTPPASKHATRRAPRTGRMAAFVDMLKRHPGEWYLYHPDCSRSAARSLRIRYGCEIKTKGMGPQRGAVYARWNGDKA